ncbi:MAG: Zn-ribbon domain-containing OB-fold protein [Chloroflexi bacterium]|nr:Zn-ribbon domain-containing OB-fold protein [Chloroflexota bacterium]
MIPLQKPERPDPLAAWRGEAKTWGRYTYGIAGERFFRSLKDTGKLLGSRCSKCGVTYIPPRMYCERCFSQLNEWLEVSSRGTVRTFTILHYALDGSPLNPPAILALVALEGTEGGLVHRLGEIEPGQVYIGMPVRMVLKPKARRQGSMLDIRYFRPLQRRAKQ